MAADPDPLADAAGAIEGLLRKFRVRDLLSGGEEQVLRECVGEIREVAAGKVLVRADVTLSESILLVDGMVARYKDLADGQRQILELHVAGDFIDLHGFLLKRLEHHVGTLTAVRLAIVPHDRLRRVTEEHPHLARMLWFSTLLDASIHRERILSVGRRTALARIAHLLCELYVRLEIVEGDADRDRHALAADDAFAVAERRDHVEEAARAFRHRRLHEQLIALVVEAHRDDRAALGEHAFGKVRGALRDEAQGDTVFTAFLGDPLEDLADGLADENSYALPLTQADLGDVTGLTSVHVNRMLKKLRDDELLTFRSGEVVIHDWDRLQRTAEFNLNYLYLERRPR